MKIGYGEFSLFVGPVTELATQAIVSPINAEMIPSAGLGKAVAELAGPHMARELAKHTYSAIGSVVKTSGGALPSKLILHAVTMSLKADVTTESFEGTLKSVLQTCRDDEIQSVGIPVVELAPRSMNIGAIVELCTGLAVRSLKGARFPARIVYAVPTDTNSERFTKAAWLKAIEA